VGALLRVKKFVKAKIPLFVFLNRFWRQRTVEEIRRTILSALPFLDPDIFFVQIGANDGKSRDPLYEFVVANKWRGLLVEPLPDVFDQLKENYKACSELTFENVAIAEQSGECLMYRISQDAIQKNMLPPWCGGIGSLLPERNSLGGRRVSKEDFREIQKHVVKQSVTASTLNELLERNSIKEFDVLVIDAEGYDYKILQQLDFRRHQPSLIQIEFVNLPESEQAAAISLLQSQGYKLKVEADLLAWRPGVLRRSLWILAKRGAGSRS
jgi:FkbM family methyltransferase